MDPFYELYKDAGLIPIEIGTNGVIALICFTGIFLNLSLVYVTMKTKSLHSPCNILIALYAFCISFLLFGYTFKFFIFLFGINYITLRTCYFIQFIPLIGTNIGGKLQLCIGIDRFVGFLYPIWYKLRGQFALFKVMLILVSTNSLITNCFFYYGSSLHWDKPVMCNFGEPARQAETVNFSNYSFLVIYSADFMCYALIWAMIYCRKSDVSLKNKKLMLSLSVIMFIGLIGYILNLIFYNMILPLLNLNIFTIEYAILPISTGIFMIASSSTAPILYFCSNDYYHAFRKCFGKTQQQPTNVVFLTTNHLNSSKDQVSIRY